jgi:hypothetical protein
MKGAHSFRLNESLEAEIAPIAAKFGLSIGQYARALACEKHDIKAPLARRPPPPDADMFREALAQLGSISNQINQLTKSVTESKAVDPRAVEALSQEYRRATDVLCLALKVRDIDR